MSRTESTMVELGTVAPAFALPDVVSGEVVTRDALAAGAAGLLVMFVCVHCPYVKHIEEEMARIGVDYAGRLAMVAISSNDIVGFPQDGPEPMKEQATRLGWRFPYLLDEAQEAARAYDAACTPDFFLFDREMRLVYRGQFDASRPLRRDESPIAIPVTGEDLRRAMEEVVAGRTPSAEQRNSIGCNIKWKS
jgi:peroxiredoxin